MCLYEHQHKLHNFFGLKIETKDKDVDGGGETEEMEKTTGKGIRKKKKHLQMSSLGCQTGTHSSEQADGDDTFSPLPSSWPFSCLLEDHWEREEEEEEEERVDFFFFFFNTNIKRKKENERKKGRKKWRLVITTNGIATTPVATPQCSSTVLVGGGEKAPHERHSAHCTHERTNQRRKYKYILCFCLPSCLPLS